MADNSRARQPSNKIPRLPRDWLVTEDPERRPIWKVSILSASLLVAYLSTA